MPVPSLAKFNEDALSAFAKLMVEPPFSETLTAFAELATDTMAPAAAEPARELTVIARNDAGVTPASVVKPILDATVATPVKFRIPLPEAEPRLLTLEISAPLATDTTPSNAKPIPSGDDVEPTVDAGEEVNDIA